MEFGVFLLRGENATERMSKGMALGKSTSKLFKNCSPYVGYILQRSDQVLCFLHVAILKSVC